MLDAEELGIAPWCVGCGLPDHEVVDPFVAPDRFIEDMLKMAVMGVE